jgi:hypothetical protein
VVKYDRRRRLQLVDVLRRLDAGHARHANVEQHHIRQMLLAQMQGLLAGGALADHLADAGIADDAAQAFARQVFVVNDQYLHRNGSSRAS